MDIGLSPDQLRVLGAAHVADALTKLMLPKRFARPGTKPAFALDRLVVGRALPVRHFGSIEVFLAAFDRARPGDILVIDNGGRLDEGCIGDLNVAEAQIAGIAGIVIDGAHRDTAQLREIGLPVFSLGCVPYGPSARPPINGPAMLGDATVTEDDVIVADEDGVIVVPSARLPEVVSEALAIARREVKQRSAMRDGTTLRDQLKFREFLAARERDSSLTFREHVALVRKLDETGRG